ncbi:hypothetical protein HRI_000733500 [Hibiscus trionum]|uniref:Uncharacterized protein n=1 Tax=Hibiscus trionum TaxID=183268 RepID=A0A9W7H417_HIBTR|nr:hypothetical protein HRI_000733500 [Hibiscus trionum]
MCPTESGGSAQWLAECIDQVALSLGNQRIQTQMVTMHNKNTGESRFLAMDAKSPNLDIVVVVKLPRRVPYSFHRLFVRESDLNKL